MAPIEFEVPLRTTTGMNSRLCWQAKARNVRAERAMVAGHCVVYARIAILTLRQYAYLGGRLAVTLTRVSPRKCDGDNLQGALKHVRDQVAQELGLDDGDARLTWLYQQEQRGRGHWGVRIRIEEAP